MPHDTRKHLQRKLCQHAPIGTTMDWLRKSRQQGNLAEVRMWGRTSPSSGRTSEACCWDEKWTRARCNSLLQKSDNNKHQPTIIGVVSQSLFLTVLNPVIHFNVEYPSVLSRIFLKNKIQVYHVSIIFWLWHSWSQTGWGSQPHFWKQAACGGWCSCSSRGQQEAFNNYFMPGMLESHCQRGLDNSHC